METVLDTIERDGVEQLVDMLDDAELRTEISRAIHDAVLTYMQKPVSEILSNVELKRDPDAPRRLAQTTAPLMWDWINAELPSLIQRLDVQAMVERKVMAFSVDRVEEILRSVINNELRLIIIIGYCLGAVVGVVTFGISKVIGL
jgi:uncharacterized membrane protein YheB (UPF0754 family)